MSGHSRNRWVAWVLGGAVAAQGLMLLYLGQLTGRVAAQTVLVLVALGVLTHQAWEHRVGLPHRVDMILVMLALGGLGMIIGWWIDFGMAPAPSWLRLGGMAPRPWSFWSRVWSWMTGLMLLGAIPPSLAWTRCARLARLSRRRWVSTHLLGNAAMVAGMIWTNRWLGRTVGHLAGSLVVGAHVAMLLGMTIGMTAGMWLGEAALGLRPWREDPPAIESLRS
ncbi:MAG TPA: hypothetical protein PKL08_01125 [Thermoanaerobaculaceae bacterium]|nr:hypothetical protein [Thermoanaerobaculaceae bacterium]